MNSAVIISSGVVTFEFDIQIKRKAHLSRPFVHSSSQLASAGAEPLKQKESATVFLAAE